jgi:hypothetical protein
MYLKGAPPLLCPACGVPIPAPLACAHLSQHEVRFRSASVEGDSIGAEVRQRGLVRVSQAHARLRWREQCSCGSRDRNSVPSQRET